MDTRLKILTPGESEWRDTKFGDCVLVTGFFDPLVAAHVQMLEQLAGDREVAVFLQDPPEPVLSSRARAELLAGLKVVKYVTLPAGNGGPAYPASVLPQDVQDTSSADQRAREALIARIESRY